MTEKKNEDSPAVTPEELINKNTFLALKQAGRDLKDGKATSQVVTLFAELALEEKRLALQKQLLELELMRAKIASTEAATEILDLKDDVLKAIESYSPEAPL